MVRDLNISVKKEEKANKKPKKRGVGSRILQITAAVVVIIPIVFAVYLFYWKDIKDAGTNVKSGVDTKVDKVKESVKEDNEKGSTDLPSDGNSFIKDNMNKLFK
ncbi:hypothetical protein [Bacillus sp. NEAU-Y102]